MVGKMKIKQDMKVMNFFKKFPLFEKCPQNCYPLLNRYAVSKHFLFGKSLIDNDQKVKGFYLVRKGIVKVSKRNPILG